MAEPISGTEKKILSVDMFGGFSMCYAGRKIAFSRSSNTKFIQLLHLLFLHIDGGISKKELIDTLYGWDEGVNSNKNLNNVIYRLKKQLTLAGLPEEEYVVLENGMCRWNSSFPVEVDVVLFQSCIELAGQESGDKRIRLLKQAEQLYLGEFLPGFSTEFWVIERNLHFRELYEAAVGELGEYLRQAGSYQEALQIYRKAGRLYPYDRWQMQEIDCLMQMKEYQEAYDVYQDTASLYSEKLGVPPDSEMVSRLRRIEQEIRSPIGNFEDLKQNFLVQPGSGAYYCLYPNFLDSCQLLARVAERTGRSIFLMLINLTNRQGEEMADTEWLETQMELLKEAVRKTFRRGDLFTTYSKSQYMVVLVGTEKENCSKAFNRCLDKWKQTAGTRGELSYSVESLVRMLNVEAENQDMQLSWS